MTLPPYDLNAGCKMCGWEASLLAPIDRVFAGSRFCRGEIIKAQYTDGKSGHWNDCLMKSIGREGSITPHIHRTCPRCGYEWIEGTVKEER